ncbi:DNA-binding winged helix-turn-helix (wHTH) domain-containing protein [Alteromonadaceae bacterium Bs31]|nr:DNA-binding winged helix-turn-helix (wHTH) domain-containing protein [Alteromonadaceae bacterium Bs31]
MDSDSYIIGEWTVEPKLNRLSREDENGVKQELILVPKVMTLLQCLKEHAGQPVAQEALMEEIWPNRVVSDSSIYQAVAQLRKALGDTKTKKEYVDRVSGQGYCLIAKCNPVTSEAKPIVSPQETQEAAPTFARRNNTTFKLGLAGIGLLSLTFSLALYFNSGSSVGGASSGLTSVAKQSNNGVDIHKLKSISLLTLDTEATSEKQLVALNDVILSQLSHIGHMKIVTLPSAHETPSTQAVLKGSIHQQGSDIRVFLQLEATKNGEVIWAKLFKGDTADLFSLQDQIVNKLLLLFKRSQSSALSAKESMGKHSFDRYLLARHLWGQHTPIALEKAKNIYEDMEKGGQLFPLAAVGLCDTYHFLYIYADWTIDKALAKCSPLLDAALIEQPNLGQALASKAFLLSRSSQPEQAEELFKRAIRLAPNYAFAHMWYGNFIRDQGRINDALKHTAMAYELAPMSAIVNRSLAYSYLNLHDLPEAAFYYQRSLSIEPNYTNRAAEELEFLPLTSERVQGFNKWLITHHSALTKQPSFRLKQAQIELALGHHEAADEIIKTINSNEVSNGYLWYVQASYHVSIGELTHASQLFNRRSKLNPDSLKLALPYIFSLYELQNYKQAYKELLDAVPELAFEDTLITEQNQDLLFFYLLLSKHLDHPVAKLSKRLEQWFAINADNWELRESIPSVEWLLFSSEKQQAQTMLQGMMAKGWLPDTNVDPFIERKMKRLFIESGLGEEQFTKILADNRQQSLSSL